MPLDTQQVKRTWLSLNCADDYSDFDSKSKIFDEWVASLRYEVVAIRDQYELTAGDPPGFVRFSRMGKVIKHGTATSYRYHRCRCEECTEANTNKSKTRRKKMDEEKLFKPREGMSDQEARVWDIAHSRMKHYPSMSEGVAVFVHDILFQYGLIGTNKEETNDGSN